MSRERVTEKSVLWWEANHPGAHAKSMRDRLERQQAMSALRREQLLGAIPQWYATPMSAYSIKEDGWGRHAGVGYGAGTARSMLLKLAKDGLVEAIEPDEGYRDYRFRLVNDGSVPEPPPPPPRDPEKRRITGVFASEVIDLIRYGLATDGANHKQWYLEQIANALGVDDLLAGEVYEPGIAP